MRQCEFLQTLPTELRLRIYEYILTFAQPIKLRQVIPGSRNLAILRTNKQIHFEALSVLYDLNTIVVTRNDFCKNTEASLKTPLKLDHARHLLITSFSQSIACTLSGHGGQCDVCQPSASGLIEALTCMPRLRTVLVDYKNHCREMNGVRGNLERETGLTLRFVSSDIGLGSYQLRGPGIGGLEIQFVCGRLEGSAGDGFTW